MLQTRNGKRTAPAALKIAVDMAQEGLISKSQAILSLKPDLVDQLLHPTLDPKAKKDVIAKGLPASPGAAGGKVALLEYAHILTSAMTTITLTNHHSNFRDAVSPALYSDVHDLACSGGLLC